MLADPLALQRPLGGRRATARSRHVRRLSAVLLWVGASVAVSGWMLGTPWILAAGTAGICLGLLASDVARAGQGGITPITFLALGSAVTALANAYGLRQAYSPLRVRYFVYAVEEYSMLAVMLALAGGVLSVLGFWAIARSRSGAAVFDILPRVSGEISDRVLIRWGPPLALLAIIAHAARSVPSLGTLSELFFFVPHLVAFTLARVGAAKGDTKAMYLALAVALAEAARALLFAFLRTDVVLPLAAFSFGLLLGARSLKPLKSAVFLPVYGALLVFIVFFGAFAAVRSTTSPGVERLEMVYEYQMEGVEPDAPAKQTLVSRLTSFNQLSQIGRVVAEDGFLDGATLEYLGYAFVPRFLWPEKPAIAKGAWFAWRIGQAHVLADGRYSNSVNMTVPGELYLNFGWPGVLLGCTLFGVLLAIFWTRMSFWRDERDTLGSAFAFYLLWVGLGLGADLQIIVTLIATYMVFVAAGAGIRATLGERRRPRSRLDTMARAAR